MLAIMEFALTSARREAEICRLEWKDNDEICFPEIAISTYSAAANSSYKCNKG
jgi:hypothetical protein